MVYDEALAARVREAVGERTDFDEKRMFGGLAFMVNTHMACGMIGDDLMVRVGASGHDAALAHGASEMEFTGRPMRGMVLVAGRYLEDPTALDDWVALAVSHALSQPPKAPKPSKVAKKRAGQD